MSKVELKYIELKSGYNNDGPAWIGYVTKSKSGQTLYFDNKAFQSQKGYQGAFNNSNYFEIISKDEYWISGIKKQGSNRRTGYSGKTFIEKRAVKEYCAIKEIKQIPKGKFEIVEYGKTNNKEIENTEELRNSL